MNQTFLQCAESCHLLSKPTGLADGLGLRDVLLDVGYPDTPPSLVPPFFPLGFLERLGRLFTGHSNTSD
jgi:hypothetical protein